MASKELIEKVAKDISLGIFEDTPPTAMAADILSTVADHLDRKADNARNVAKDLHIKRKSGKYGLKKQTRFFEEGKHYTRLAIGYAKSARAIRALGEQSE